MGCIKISAIDFDKDLQLILIFLSYEIFATLTVFCEPNFSDKNFIITFCDIYTQRQKKLRHFSGGKYFVKATHPNFSLFSTR